MVRPVSEPRRALVLAHEPQGTSALVGERLAQRGYDVHEHVVTANLDRPNDAAPFPDAADYDVLVPMGSIRSLTNTGEIDSWIFDEIDMMRAARQRGAPILGVCFGGQLLAACFGGAVEEAPVPEIGWYEVYEPGPSPNGARNPLGGQLLAACFGGAVEEAPVPEIGWYEVYEPGPSPNGARNPLGAGPWFQWHHDRFTAPPEADVLAVNDNAVQLFRLGRCVGTQFHPEVTYAHLEGFLSEADEEYLATHGVSREGLLESVRYHEDRNARQCAALVDWFLDEVAHS